MRFSSSMGQQQQSTSSSDLFPPSYSSQLGRRSAQAEAENGHFVIVGSKAVRADEVPAGMTRLELTVSDVTERLKSKLSRVDFVTLFHPPQ